MEEHHETRSCYYWKSWQLGIWKSTLNNKVVMSLWSRTLGRHGLAFKTRIKTSELPPTPLESVDYWMKWNIMAVLSHYRPPSGPQKLQVYCVSWFCCNTLKMCLCLNQNINMRILLCGFRATPPKSRVNDFGFWLYPLRICRCNQIRTMHQSRVMVALKYRSSTNYWGSAHFCYSIRLTQV